MTPKPTILVVDDETHISHVVSFKLGQAGMRVLTAADGEEGFEIALRELPDLIVTDFQMPIMTGLELSWKLRENPQTAMIPVLVVTARGHLLTDNDLARTNVKGVMCKPFSPRHLLEKVRELLGGSPAAGAVAA
jgi:two-component system alkaline phosphatase synthesis response regulator PhoP